MITIRLTLEDAWPGDFYFMTYHGIRYVVLVVAAVDVDEDELAPDTDITYVTSHKVRRILYGDYAWHDVDVKLLVRATR